MLELGHRERHLVSGLVVQVLVVAVLVFAYTQAIRYLKHERDRFLQMQEQLIQANDRIEREKGVDVERLQNQIQALKAVLATPETLADWSHRLEVLAIQKFSFREVKVEVGGTPEKMVSLPIPNSRIPFEIKLYPLKLEGKATTQNGADLLATLKESPLLWVLETMQLQGLAPEDAGVAIHFKWLVAVLPEKESAAPSAEFPSLVKKSSSWGDRAEPFLSPLEYPSSSQISQGKAPLQLTSIHWDPENPSCIINGTILRPGDSVEGYRLVVLTSQGAILERSREEILLRLPI